MVLHIYTDGSIRKSAGWAYVIQGDEDSCRGGHCEATDSYVAELMGIVSALESLDNPQKVIIHTDHEGLSRMINSENRKWGNYPELHDRLFEQMEKHDVSVEHHKRNTNKWAKYVHDVSRLSANVAIP